MTRPSVRLTAESAAGSVALALIATAVVFAWRWAVFGDAEPRADQAQFAWWVQGLSRATHWLPVPADGETWLAALERDSGGVLAQLARGLYNKPVAVFTLLPLAIFAGAAEVLGDSYRVLVGAGILASAATVGALALAASAWTPAGIARPPGWTAVAAAAAAAAALYPHVFAPMGVHNVGALLLVVAVAVTGRCLPVALAGAGGHRRAALAIAVAQGLALYAHWTNVLVLPLASVLFVATWPGIAARRRLRAVAVYATTAAVFVSPALALAAAQAIRPPAAGTEALSVVQSFGALSSIALGSAETPFSGVAARAGAWFEAGAHLFSAPGLALGLVGLAGLAWRHRLTMPLAAIGAHFGIWCLLPAFAGASLRTFVYVLPFLALGVGYAVAAPAVAAARTRTRRIPAAGAAVLAGALAAVHLAQQLPVLVSVARLEHRVPAAWSTYVAGQGSLRPMIAEAERIMAPRAVLFTWGYGLQFVVRNLATGHADLRVPPAVSVLAAHGSDEALRDRLARRRLALPAGWPVYAMIDTELEPVTEAALEGALSRVLGEAGFGIAEAVRVTPVGRWSTGASWPRRVVLYAIEGDGDGQGPAGGASGRGPAKSVHRNQADARSRTGPTALNSGRPMLSPAPAQTARTAATASATADADSQRPGTPPTPTSPSGSSQPKV